MKYFPRGPLLVFAVVLAWRVLLLSFTVQPIPASDAFGYDGGVVNCLHGGGYCNPSLALVFPISGRQIYATYPPLYQGALFVWMTVFGTSVVSAIGLHLALFALSGFLVLWIVRRFFPGGVEYAFATWLFFGITFDDRPEGLAYVFGLLCLGLAARQIAEPNFRWATAAGLAVCLLFCLYTSVIVGTYFFGVGFLACAAACGWRRKGYWLAPFIGAAAMFGAITFAIARLEPVWWAAFMESARQQSVMTTGFHLPDIPDLIKAVRTVPIFVLGAAAAPLVWRRRQEIFSHDSPWLALTAAILGMGWILLALSLTLLPANYCNYVVLTQIILAAGLLALARTYSPRWERWLRVALLGCVLLVSVRAVGMSTWGVACACKNSYRNTQTLLRGELAPFVATAQPVLISSPYLYDAVGQGVKYPVHSDWYFDHAAWTNNAEINALAGLRPPKLVLTQFDYFRNFQGVLDQLRQHPELVEVRVRNLARLRAPDSIPAFQRVVQHVSWAPVIVDLIWQTPPKP